jgi:hypothetical protein
VSQRDEQRIAQLEVIFAERLTRVRQRQARAALNEGTLDAAQAEDVLAADLAADRAFIVNAAWEERLARLRGTRIASSPNPDMTYMPSMATWLVSYFPSERVPRTSPDSLQEAMRLPQGHPWRAQANWWLIAIGGLDGMPLRRRCEQGFASWCIQTGQLTGVGDVVARHVDGIDSYNTVGVSELEIVRRDIIERAEQRRKDWLEERVTILDAEEPPELSAAVQICRHFPDERAPHQQVEFLQWRAERRYGSLGQLRAELYLNAMGAPDGIPLRQRFERGFVAAYLARRTNGCSQRSDDLIKSGCNACTFYGLHDLLPVDCYDKRSAAACPCQALPDHVDRIGPRRDLGVWSYPLTVIGQRLHERARYLNGNTGGFETPAACFPTQQAVTDMAINEMDRVARIEAGKEARQREHADREQLIAVLRARLAAEIEYGTDGR